MVTSTANTASSVSLSAEQMQTNAVGAATGMEIGMLGAAERMRIGTTTSAQTMSTDLISAVQPASMQLPQHFQIMADQAIMSMQNMGITSLEEANDLVSGLGLKWEEMASWSEKDWSAVNATVSQNMVTAAQNRAGILGGYSFGVGGTVRTCWNHRS